MNGRSYFEIRLDTAGLDSDTKRAQQMFRNVGKTAVAEGQQIDNMLRTVGRGMATYLGGRELLRFGRDIVEVRGEFQGLQLAFETMLGSKQKADKMLSDVVSLAAKTPYTLTEVANNTKQLMAMGIAADDVMGTMKSLGDVAAGLNVPMARLAINYGQVATLGKLQSRELRDFMIAGVPLAEELAKILGKQKEEISGMISAGQIGFSDVEAAFKSMSSEGGKFADMMEKRNSTITGQISNLQDKIEMMMNSIGQANEGIIYAGIEGAATLVEHYNEIGNAIIELVGIYGTYKAILITTSAIDKAVAATKYTAEATELSRLLTIEQQANISKKNLTKGSLEHAAAIKAEIVAEMERQTSIAAATNTEIATLQAKLTARRAEKVAALEAVAVKEAELAAIVKSGSFKEIQAAQIQLETAQKKLNTAATAENTAAMELNSRRAVLDSAVRKANTLETGLNTAAKNANVTSTNILSAAKLRLTAISTRLNAIIAANPYTAVAIAVAALGYAIYKLATYQTDAEKRFEKLNDSVKEFQKNSLSQISTLSRLKGELSSLEKGTEEYQKIKDKIIKEFGKYDENLSNEIDKVGLTTEAYNKLTTAITNSFGARQYDKFQEEQSNYLGEVLADNLKNIQDKLIEELGDEAGSKYFAKIREGLLNQQLSIGRDGLFDIKGLDAETEAILDKISGVTDKDVFKHYDIESYIQNVIRAQDQVEKLDEKAKERLGIISLLKEDDPDKAEEVLKTIQQQIDDTTKAITEAEAKLKELRASDSTATIEDIKKQEEVVKGLKTSLETLTGIKQKEVDKQLKSEEDRLKALQELADQELALKQNLEQSKVEAMREGFEKQREQVKLAYDQELADIDKQGRNYLERLNDSKGLKITDKGYITELPADVQANLNEQKKNAEINYSNELAQLNRRTADEVNSVLAEVNERFTSELYNQLIQLESYYQNQLDVLRKNVKTSEELNRLEVELEDKKQREINIIREEYDLKKLDFEEQLALKKQEYANEELSWEADKQKKLLQLQLQYATRRLNALNNIKINGGDAEEEIAKLRAEIERLNAELNKTDSSKVREIATVLGSALSDISSTLSEIPGTIGDIGDGIGNIAGNIQEINSFLDGTASNADIISASANAIKNIVTLVADQIARNKDVQEDWNEKLANTYHLASLARIELQAYEEANIFGIEDPFEKARTGANKYTAAIDELKNRAEALGQGQIQIGTEKVRSLSNIAKGLTTGPFGGIVGFFSKKRVPVFESLLQHYGKLFDEETFELNPDILADYDKLDDATKKLVDNWEEIREKALEAEEQMRDTFKSLAGDIGNQLSDALVYAFKNNALTSAMDDFEDSVGNMIENIISQMIFAQYFQGMLDDLQKGFNDSFGIQTDGVDADPTKYDESIIDDIINFSKNYAAAIPDFMATIEGAREAMKAEGFDLFNPDNRTPVSKGITQASQDSVNELNGRFTVIQSHTYQMNNNVEILTSNSGAILNHLAGIRQNTNELQRLKNIETNITSMKRSISDINDKGIKLRNQ